MDYVADFVKASATISIPNPLPSHTGHHHEPHHSHPSHGHHGHEGGDVHFAMATKTGEKTLMVVFWLFAIGFTVATLGALRVEKKARLFHILTASVLGCAMISYLAMASGLGVKLVATLESKHNAVTLVRQVYYARYIDWLFTTPLLLVSLAFLAGLSTIDTVIVVLFDVGMIVTGLLGGVSKAVSKATITAKWTWYTISCVFFVGILYMLFTSGVKAANLRPSKTRGLFYLLGGMTGVLWTAYPIVWAITEGKPLISVDKEIIAYAILDVAAKLGFGFLLLGVHGGGNGEDDYVMPEWAVTPRSGSEGGRGGYGSIRVGDD